MGRREEVLANITETDAKPNSICVICMRISVFMCAPKFLFDERKVPLKQIKSLFIIVHVNKTCQPKLKTVTSCFSQNKDSQKDTTQSSTSNK